MTVLKLAGIRKRFGSTVALDGVGLELRSGEVLALIGENGAGKSTLMNILSGTLPPDAGTMELAGQPFLPASPLDAKAHGIAHIHQELSLCNHLTVAENILLGAEPSHLGWIQRDAMLARAAELLATFGHSDIQPTARVADLPPASRQIVEICRALAGNARIILMDEPTSSLQKDDVERLFANIRNLCARQISIIYISHFLEEVRAIAGRYTVLRDGVSVSSGELSNTTDDQLIAHMVGRPVESVFHHTRASAPSGETILKVKGLSAPPTVRDASFELRRGEVLGIGGLIGSGRTELVRALFGLDPASAGEIILRDQPVTLRGSTPANSIARSLGYLSEDRKGEGLMHHLSVEDNLTVTRTSTYSRFGWIDAAARTQQATGWISKMRIKTPSAASSIRQLSGGNQQKVMLARLLHQDSDVLLLDEPTRGVDIGSKAEIYEHISQLASSGKALLVVSSYLPELFGICDRLAVMSSGKLSATRPISEWTPESVLQAAISGESQTT